MDRGDGMDCMDRPESSEALACTSLLVRKMTSGGGREGLRILRRSRQGADSFGAGSFGAGS